MSLSVILHSAFAAALLAAVGNALFAFGQRRAEIAANPFLFVFCAFLISTTAFGLTLPFFQRGDFSAYIARNGLSIAASGIGLYLTTVGFYYLYTVHGASYYVLYAVLAILTTTVVVGLILFREPLNRYHMAAIAAALVAVVLFGLAQNQPR